MPDFYGLPRNTDTVTLKHQAVDIPREVDFGGQPGVPFRAGGRTRWWLVDFSRACIGIGPPWPASHQSKDVVTSTHQSG